MMQLGGELSRRPPGQQRRCVKPGVEGRGRRTLAEPSPSSHSRRPMLIRGSTRAFR